MKNLLLIFTLLFTSVFFSSPSYAEWTKTSENTNGDTHYVDFERIRKHDGFVYYWELQDFLKPITGGYLSAKVYIQVDCKLFRYKNLSISTHKEPMGGGTGKTFTYNDDKWFYPPPNTVIETILKSVCSR